MPRHAIAGLAIGCLPATAFGQGTPLYQQGVTAPGSPAVLIENGKIADGLVVGQRGAKVYGPGTPNCTYDTWPLPAHSICLGAAAGGATIKVDGVPYPFPGAGAVLPTNFTVPAHQNQGGNATGHYVPFLDGNIDVVADHIGVQTVDRSLSVSGTATGTPTPSETPGFNLTLNAIAYTIRYTVQGGDTNASIMAALASGFGATPAAHVTVTPPTLYADLLALGYVAQAANTGASIGLDLPWGLATAFTGVNSANTTITVGSFPSAFNLDNGPYIYAQRYVEGRTPTTNDPIGWFRGDSASGAASGVDTQYGGLKIRVGVVDATNPQGTVSLEGSGVGGGNKASVPLWSCELGRGCWVESGTTSNPNRALAAGKGGLGFVGPLVQSTGSTGAIATFGSTGGSGWLSVGDNAASVLVGAIGSAPFIQASSTVLQVQQSGGNPGIVSASALQLDSPASLGNFALNLDGGLNTVLTSRSAKTLTMGAGGGANIVVDATRIALNGVPHVSFATWANNQPCTAGDIDFDASFLYVCTALNTVKRAALSAF